MGRTTALLLAALALPALAPPALASPAPALPALALLASATEERVATFEVRSEAGSFPVGERDVDWSTPGDDVRVWESGGVLKFDVDSVAGPDLIRVELAAAGGATLEVGTYTDPTWRADPAKPTLRVIAKGLVCAPVFGHFTVHHVERDPGTGALTDVDVEVEQRCGAADAPAFRGRATLSS
ncbi:hypothetical protein [Saccharothrix sp. Mg75]|uniref:hypothetical protein n=1 Tax=Saccharothrix sp. Mg75 TaxID=3445357 RepID=UPI003EEAC213